MAGRRAALGVVKSLDDYQRRTRWLGWPLAVVYKLVDDQATALAAMITYYGFVSLFPLLLLLVTCLGFAMTGNPDLQQRVLHSALREFPVIGDQIGQNVHSLHGSVTGLVVGICGSLYGGLGVALAIQNAMNKIWAIPRAERPSLVGAYGRGFALLGMLGASVAVTTTLSAQAITARLGQHGAGDVAERVGAGAASVALNTALVMVTYRLLTSHSPSIRRLWPGALTAAVLWALVLNLGTYLVGHELRGATATYGLFGIVLGLLSWIYLGALILLLGAEINSVRVRGLHPRSLLALDPSDSGLTPADRRAYASYARTEQQKTSQIVRSRFTEPRLEHPPDH